MFKAAAGVELLHVPYKGVAPALTDLIPGNLHLLVSTIPACLQFVKSGQVKALAVPSLQKSPALPNVPVAVDTVPGLVGELWVAVYAPKGVPRPMIDQVAQAVAKVQALPDFESFLAAQGAQEMKAGPAELLAITKDELTKWAPIVKESGLTVD
jgi:tripartite-type tricarboxylate transporter receptor subunit TctC